MVIVFECLEEWICLTSAPVFPFTLKGGFSIFFCSKIFTEHADKTKMGNSGVFICFEKCHQQCRLCQCLKGIQNPLLLFFPL